jgi:hypothetical protein
VGLELNSTHLLLVYVDEEDLLDRNTATIETSTKTLTAASTEVNTEKTKYILLSCHQNVEKYDDIKTANRSFEILTQFKYLAMTVTNQ